jgi:hypothetical protein
MDTIYEITINAHCHETREAFDRWYKAKEEYDSAWYQLKSSVEKSEPVRTTIRTTPYTSIAEIKANGEWH